MKGTLAIVLLALVAALLSSLSGCASYSDDGGAYYYSTGTIHQDAYPRAAAYGGYYGYGRYGRPAGYY